MRRACEVFQRAPDGADGEGSAKTPEHGLNENGTLKLVGFFSDVEAYDGECSNQGQCGQDCEEINDETGWMEMVETPFGDEEKEEIDRHRRGEAVDVAASGFCCWKALHDKIPFHKDN